MNRANAPSKPSTITQISHETQKPPVAKATKNQKRHQRIPSQTMQLSKTEAPSEEANKKGAVSGTFVVAAARSVGSFYSRPASTVNASSHSFFYSGF
jgi:hypothetical protein